MSQKKNNRTKSLVFKFAYYNIHFRYYGLNEKKKNNTWLQGQLKKEKIIKLNNAIYKYVSGSHQYKTCDVLLNLHATRRQVTFPTKRKALCSESRKNFFDKYLLEHRFQKYKSQNS